MKKILILFLLTPLAYATDFNVNSSMSTATIQATMITADATPGNRVVFAAGTYNLSTHLLPPCQNGTIYTGPVNSAGVVAGSDNKWVQQTAASPTIINYVANGDSAIIFSGCSGGSAGAAATWQWISGRYQVFTGGIPNVSTVNTSGILIQHNTFAGNTAAFSNPAGVSIFLDYLTSNTTVQFNYLSNCADHLDGCGGMAWAGTNNLIINNIINGTQEGIGSSGPTGGGGAVISGSTNGGIVNNQFRNVNRLAIEITNGNNPGIVTGAAITGNLYIDPVGDPNLSPFSGALSMATGNFGGSGGGSSGFTYHADDNTWIANTSFNTSGGNHMFYGEELTSGSNWSSNRGLTQGFWPGAPAVAIGNILNVGTVLNKIIEGPNLTTFGMGLGCEYGGTINPCNNSGSGTVPNVTITGTTVSSTHTQHASTAPSISPSSGAFGSPPTVTVTTNQANGSSFYTTDGSTPTTASTLYTGTFACGSLPCTIKVLSQWGTGVNTAYLYPSGYGWAPSSVTSASYTSSGTVVTDPTCTPTAGTYSSTQSVTCSSVTPASTTYCTIDGTTPTSASPVCTAISVASTLILKAISEAAGATNSNIVPFNYVITGATTSVGNMYGSPIITGTGIIY